MLHLDCQCFSELWFFNASDAGNSRSFAIIAGMKRAEDHLQAQIVKWWQEAYPERRADLFHVPNEAKRTPQEAGRMAAIGLMPGVPDLLLHVGDNRFVPIEVKAEGRRLSEAQKSIRKFWGGRGTIIHVVRSVQDFQEIIRPWIEK